MSGKSRRRRPKLKNKARRQQAPVQPVRAAATSPGNAAPAAPVANTPAAKIKPVSAGASKAQYPFFTSELKRIGIISGIIIVVLIVLTVILT